MFNKMSWKLHGKQYNFIRKLCMESLQDKYFLIGRDLGAFQLSSLSCIFYFLKMHMALSEICGYFCFFRDRIDILVGREGMYIFCISFAI